MKKILISIFAIAAVAVAAGIGSWAMWSDTEGSNNNTITADKLDLTVSGVPISISNVMPGQTGSQVLVIKNNSNTVSGDLTFSVTDLVNEENGCVEPEQNEGGDTSCGPNEGELGAYVYIDSIEIADTDGNGTVVGSYQAVPGWTPVDLNTFATPGYLSGFSYHMPAGTEKAIRVNWKVANNPTDFTDNVFMTDSVTADFMARLTQSPTQP